MTHLIAFVAPLVTGFAFGVIAQATRCTVAAGRTDERYARKHGEFVRCAHELNSCRTACERSET